MLIQALIRTYSGGLYGRPGAYIAVVEPQFFKNGKMKKSNFRVVEVLTILEKGYSHHCACHSETIAEVLETPTIIKDGDKQSYIFKGGLKYEV